jgi:hypothetical protein
MFLCKVEISVLLRATYVGQDLAAGALLDPGGFSVLDWMHRACSDVLQV